MLPSIHHVSPVLKSSVCRVGIPTPTDAPKRSSWALHSNGATHDNAAKMMVVVNSKLFMICQLLVAGCSSWIACSSGRIVATHPFTVNHSVIGLLSGRLGRFNTNNERTTRSDTRDLPVTDDPLVCTLLPLHTRDDVLP